MKKSRFLRKLVSIFLAGTMILNGVTASGENVNAFDLQAVSNSGEITEYVRRILPSHLMVHRNSIANFKISQPYLLYSEDGIVENRNIYFVFEGKNLFGILTVTSEARNYNSTFEICNHNSITDAYLNNESVAFYVSNGNFIMLKEKNSIIINSAVDAKEAIIDYSLVELDQIRITDVDYSSLPTVAATSYYYNTNCPYVANQTINNKGICWAASVASKVRLLTSNTSVTATDVYSYCYYHYNNGTYTDSVPQGNTAWIKIAYSLYGIQTTSTDSNLRLTSIINELSSNNPIHMRLIDGDSKHSVLLSGISGTSQNGVFLIRDPNYSAIQTCSYNNGSSDITYTPTNSSHNYQWSVSIY